MEKQCRNSKPEGIIYAGDVIYPDGVTSVEDGQWDEKVFSLLAGSCLKDVPIYPVLGNHDYNGNTQSWIAMSAINPKWKFPSRHYAVAFPGFVTIFALDTYYPVGFKKSGMKKIEDIKTPWSIAIGHHPLISQSTAGGET